jgi:hypothetical protein
MSEIRLTLRGLSEDDARELGNELAQKYVNSALTGAARPHNADVEIISDERAVFDRDILRAAAHFGGPAS